MVVEPSGASSYPFLARKAHQPIAASLSQQPGQDAVGAAAHLTATKSSSSNRRRETSHDGVRAERMRTTDQEKDHSKRSGDLSSSSRSSSDDIRHHAKNEDAALCGDIDPRMAGGQTVLREAKDKHRAVEETDEEFERTRLPQKGNAINEDGSVVRARGGTEHGEPVGENSPRQPFETTDGTEYTDEGPASGEGTRTEEGTGTDGERTGTDPCGTEDELTDLEGNAGDDLAGETDEEEQRDRSENGEEDTTETSSDEEEEDGRKRSVRPELEKPGTIISTTIGTSSSVPTVATSYSTVHRQPQQPHPVSWYRAPAPSIDSRGFLTSSTLPTQILSAGTGTGYTTSYSQASCTRPSDLRIAGTDRWYCSSGSLKTSTTLSALAAPPVGHAVSNPVTTVSHTFPTTPYQPLLKQQQASSVGSFLPSVQTADGESGLRAYQGGTIASRMLSAAGGTSLPGTIGFGSSAVSGRSMPMSSASTTGTQRQDGWLATSRRGSSTPGTSHSITQTTYKSYGVPQMPSTTFPQHLKAPLQHIAAGQQVSQALISHQPLANVPFSLQPVSTALDSQKIGVPQKTLLRGAQPGHAGLLQPGAPSDMLAASAVQPRDLSSMPQHQWTSTAELRSSSVVAGVQSVISSPHEAPSVQPKPSPAANPIPSPRSVIVETRGQSRSSSTVCEQAPLSLTPLTAAECAPVTCVAPSLDPNAAVACHVVNGAPATGMSLLNTCYSGPAAPYMMPSFVDASNAIVANPTPYYPVPADATLVSQVSLGVGTAEAGDGTAATSPMQREVHSEKAHNKKPHHKPRTQRTANRDKKCSCAC